MLDYPTHCKQVVYPIFSDLMDIKRDTLKADMIHTILFHSKYLQDRDADIYALQLKQYFNDFCESVKCNSKRITLDRILADILCCIASMFNSCNRDFTGMLILNTKGRVKNHYSYKV